MTHQVQTQARTYNSVDSADHFAQVRQAWNDSSPVVSVWVWVNGQGWVQVDNSQMQ